MLDKISSKKIAIDIDDVLSLTVPNLLRFLNEVHDIKVKYEEFVNYKFYELELFNLKKIDKIKAHKLWDDFSNSHYGKNMETVEGSYEGVKKLKQLGFEIVLITARWESLKQNTEQWLKKNFPDIEFSAIYFTGSIDGKSTKKSEICKMHSIELMIEDNHENSIDLANNGIMSYLITKPWNGYYEVENNLVKRVYNWQEII